MKKNNSWICEMCAREFDTPYAVRDSVCIDNGENTRAWADVCSKCIKMVAELLDKEFSKNKYVVRAKEHEQTLAGMRTTIV